MEKTSLALLLLVVVGACFGDGRYGASESTCSPEKMKALRSAYDNQVKMLDLKSDLEAELMDLVMEGSAVCEMGLSQPAASIASARPNDTESQSLSDRRIGMYRYRLEELIASVEAGRVMLPTAENMKEGVFKKAADRMPTKVAEFDLDRYLSVLKQINSSDAALEAWYKHVTLDRSDPRVIERDAAFGRSDATLILNCDTKARSDSRPTSVHKLRPGDIDVVAAMGDSITASFGSGADFIFIYEWFYEYRGESWSAGGDHSYGQGYTTLPNILKEFNPKLRGYSEGVIKLLEDPLTSPKTQMNAAITGAVARDITSQAENLVKKLKSDLDGDVINDWKMVTLFIGANDLCGFCENEEQHSAEAFIEDIKKGLDILQANIPRVYVNLIEIFDIVPLTQMAVFEYGTLVCSAAHSLADVCSCVRDQDDLDYKFDAEALKKKSERYQKAVNDLVDSGRYDNKDDFTVVVQSFFRETGPPLDEDGDPDMSYFAQDCFHFSTKGQNRAGIGLWNSVITPIGKKPTTWNVEDLAHCPKVEYLPTKKNTQG